jgi:hypothetical protein
MGWKSVLDHESCRIPVSVLSLNPQSRGLSREIESSTQNPDSFARQPRAAMTQRDSDKRSMWAQQKLLN